MAEKKRKIIRGSISVCLGGCLGCLLLLSLAGLFWGGEVVKWKKYSGLTNLDLAGFKTFVNDHYQEMARDNVAYYLKLMLDQEIEKKKTENQQLLKDFQAIKSKEIPNEERNKIMEPIKKQGKEAVKRIQDLQEEIEYLKKVFGERAVLEKPK